MPRARKAPAPAALSALPEGYAYRELRPLVQAALETGVSVLVRGHPGIGKSSLAADLATAMGRELVDIRLAQRDPAEVAGVYFPNRETRTLELMAPDWVRQACERPTFVMLDEINAAVTKLHQAAAYQIVLERRVGPFVFHPDTVVMAAGNLEEDRAIVTPLSSALCNRFAHFIMRPDVPSWLEWAAGQGVDPQVMAFIAAHGEEVLYRASEDYAFPSPRTWAMASRVMARVEARDHKRVVATCVGAPMADRFMTYCTLFHTVPAEAIVQQGQAMRFTTGREAEPSFVHAAVFCVATYAARHPIADTALPNLVTFLRSPGLDPEYQFLFLRQVHAQAPQLTRRLRALPAYRQLAGELVGIRADAMA